MQTGSEYLLDTNIIVDLFRGDQKAADFMSTAPFSVPVIVVGELLYGANLAQLKEQRTKQVEELIKQVNVVQVDEETSEFYAKIKADLKHRGTPIPENDIWIAALSEQHSLILVTKDSHFKKILSVEVNFW